MSVKHFQLLVGALEVGLEGAEHPSLSFDMPTIIESLHPPSTVRAIVTIDDEPYEVVMRKAGLGNEAYPPENGA